MPRDGWKERAASLVNGVAGIRLGTGRGGLSASRIYEGRDDVLVMALCADASVAGVFTQNGFRAPPVQLAERRVAEGGVRALLINSGNANAATGAEGLRRCEATCRMLAGQLGIDADAVLPFSTGVIGEHLPLDAMYTGIAEATQALREDGWQAAARAIMTTDTVPKLCVRELHIDGVPVHLYGIAKGAGMIAPNMATMLAFIATDARVDSRLLARRLPRLADESFNRVTVDGDTSTNDACVLIATGASGVEVAGEGAGYAGDAGGEGDVGGEADAGHGFWQALESLMQELASALIEDAEGGTKCVRVQVVGGRSRDECQRVARSVAESPLVKTALFAEDPNWGRICMAIGNADLEDFDQSLVDIQIGGLPVMSGGLASPEYDEKQASLVMRGTRYTLRVSLGRGEASGELLTSDLSHEYVTINADYRT